MLRHFRILLLLACGALQACGEKPAEPKPAEPLPQNQPPRVPYLKRLTDSEMYQHVRREMLKHYDPLKQVNLSTVQMTRDGLYRISIKQKPDPIELDAPQGWVLHVETPDGRPLTGATLGFSGGMPQHGHTFPTKPRVTAELGGGDYRVEGIQFSMPGWWEFNVYVSRAKREDTATFNLIIE